MEVTPWAQLFPGFEELGSSPPLPAGLGPSLGSDRPSQELQEHGSPAAPTALGLLGPGM